MVDNKPKRRQKYCNNCDKYGHAYKDCQDPIMSYGIICYKKCTETTNIKYLMIRRTNSYAYIDFLRALRSRVLMYDEAYIKMLFGYMIKREHDFIKNNINDFEKVWNNLWSLNVEKHSRDYKKCKKIFESLVSGDNEKGLHLTDILNNTETHYTDAEWGYPKGKRNISENNLNCAIREFTEESGIPSTDIKLINDPNGSVLSIIEEYRGFNNKNYRVIYYIAEYTGSIIEDSINVDQTNIEQVCEVDSIKWFYLETAISYIRNYYNSKKNILLRINNLINKK